jgi:hypothetical protein
MQDTTDEAKKAEVEENNLPESPAEETKLPETEPVVEEAETKTEEPTTEPEVEDKKSASYRIKELNEEKKAAEEKAKSLEDKMAELTGRSPGVNTQFIPPAFGQTVPEPLVKPGEEFIDPSELERRLQARLDANTQQTQQMMDLREARERNFERINSEAQKSVKKFPQLNPDSEEFDKDLSDTVSRATEGYLKGEPTGSVTKFVADLMGPYLRSINNESGKQREAITKQVSQSALRPTQVPKGEKPFGELSLGEMEARLGGVKH